MTAFSTNRISRATRRPDRSVATVRRASLARRSLMVMLTACIWCTSFGVGYARLPPPTPEQVAKAAAEAEKSKALAAQEQAALAREQDRIVLQYQSDLRKQGIVPPTPTPTGPTAQANLPKAAVAPSMSPHGGTTQSAESHSGNAK